MMMVSSLASCCCLLVSRLPNLKRESELHLRIGSFFLFSLQTCLVILADDCVSLDGFRTSLMSSFS
uniref:Uncharacterized protein n=1 Tax=Daphnia magna TaxID=35525 RepID=A0A0P6HY85_9CRUS